MHRVESMLFRHSIRHGEGWGREWFIRCLRFCTGSPPWHSRRYTEGDFTNRLHCFGTMSHTKPAATKPRRVKHYFVDEAGDLALFNRKKQVIVGTAGVSQCFMVGVAELPDPDDAQRRLENLRASLLRDPYFASVPSMHPAAKKTAIAFHAKDDLPEVRREVFRLLPTLGAKVIVAIRRKQVLAAEAEEIWLRTGTKWSANIVYDQLVKRLFRDKLHTADENRILFARRGKSDRNAALSTAIEQAKRNFALRWGKEADKPVIVGSAYPSQAVGLQVVDYYLWAIQRCYERGEDRFFRLLEPQYRLIMDLDDTRRKGYGEWYSDTNPFCIERIRLVTSG